MPLLNLVRLSHSAAVWARVQIPLLRFLESVLGVASSDFHFSQLPHALSKAKAKAMAKAGGFPFVPRLSLSTMQ